MNRFIIILLAGVLFFTFSATKCKSPASPNAVVYVVKYDAQNKAWPVVNALVHLDPPEGTSQIDLIQYTQQPKLTDANGKVTYDFQYEGIIKVVATDSEGSIDYCGQGVLILQNGETCQETIRLSACQE
ncbi:MAG: hypothetical protein NTW49_05050 [Bacteroidia bacterium]|nr:hypothetical protein [Bacteroidia bacterium]